MAPDGTAAARPAASEPAVAAGRGNVGRIPVRNIWLLMLYASRLYRELPPARRVAIEDNPDELPDLVAQLLTRAVERRLRRNLSFAFQETSADLRRVRGRIDLLRTERRHLLRRGRVACRYEELTVDTPRNRYVRAAAQKLVTVVGAAHLVSRCRAADARLEAAGVSSDPALASPRGRSAAAELRGRMDPEDRTMMAAAELAFSLALPTETAGGTYLRSPDRDEVWARRLFEAAVGGFYQVVLAPKWSTQTGRLMRWQVDGSTSRLRELLPSMTADIVLESRDRRIIIDTKFTSIVTAGHYRQATLSSEHLYQLYSYVRSQERPDDPRSLGATGMLLHPSVREDVYEAAVIQGHEVRFATVDLAACSRTIRERLLQVVAGSLFDRE